MEIPKSIKLYVVENKKITDVYVHDSMYNYRDVIELLGNFCNPDYKYDCGLTREKLYRFMLTGGTSATGEEDEPVEDIVGYVAIALLDEFEHYKNEDPNPDVEMDYTFFWNRTKSS